MAAATAALPTVTLLGAAATGNILAAASVMAASVAVWVPAAVNRVPPTPVAVNSASPVRAAVISAAVVVIRLPPTSVAVTAAAVIRAAAGVMANH